MRSPEGGVPLEREELPRRVPILVRAIFGGLAKDDADEITQRVLKKLLEKPAEKWTVAYIWTAIYRTGLDYFKEKGKHPQYDDNWEHDEDTDGPAAPPFPSAGPDEPIPMEVILERLRIVDAGGNVPALAFLYHTYLEYTPEQIVANLAAVRLADLALGFMKQFAAAVSQPLQVVFGHFPNLSAIIHTPQGSETFQEHWKPEDQVALWIAEVEEAVAKASVAAAVAANAAPEEPLQIDLGPAEKHPPNRRIAFALGSPYGLGIPPGQIVGPHGIRTLEALQTFFEANYTNPNPPLDEWKKHVVSVKSPQADRELQSYYTPARIVGRWFSKIATRMQNEEFNQEKDGLGVIFGFNGYTPEDAMAMLYVTRGFMGLDPQDVLRESRGKLFDEMEKSLEARYSAKCASGGWGTAHTRFERSDVSEWFEPLRSAVVKLPVTDFFPTPQDIEKAAKKVADIVKPGFLKGRQFPLFGWRHKLL